MGYDAVLLQKKPSERSKNAWRRVMREGCTVQQVAEEEGIRQERLERLLIAFGRRRASLLRV